MKKLMVVVMALAFVLTAGSAIAATDTATLDVKANVISMCRVTSTIDVDFGNYDPTDPNDDTDGQGSATFRCTKGTDYGTYIVRTNTMTDGTDNLTYALYTDVTRASVFPSASVGTPKSAASNSPITENIYGTISAQQNVQVGSYSETVTFTVEY